MQDPIVKNSTFLLLRADGVAIYQKRDTVTTIISHIDLWVRNTYWSIGNLCAVWIAMDDRGKLVMAVVYTLPNQKINNIIEFLHEGD